MIDCAGLSRFSACVAGGKPSTMKSEAGDHNGTPVTSLDTRKFTMKKVLLASVATLATVSAFSAFAADLPSRKAAPVYAPPPPMWTGFYAGLNAGYNFGTNGSVGSLNVAPAWGTYEGYSSATPAIAPAAMSGYGNNGNNTQSGFIGGAQVGYNYQYGSNILLGLEADIQGAGIRGASYSAGAAAAGYNLGSSPSTSSITSRAVGSTAVQGGIDWLGTVRGRVGYLWTPTLLVYGTGGFAYGGAYANVVQSAIGQLGTEGVALQSTWIGGGRQSQLLTGWTAGGGAEWMFMPNWSIKAEALYWDLGRMNVNTAAIGVAPVTYISNNVAYGRTSVNYQGVMARAGVNYHFNWGAAPVVASY
jgi:outer membrane immunogenic protein